MGSMTVFLNLHKSSFSVVYTDDESMLESTVAALRTEETEQLF